MAGLLTIWIVMAVVASGVAGNITDFREYLDLVESSQGYTPDSVYSLGPDFASIMMRDAILMYTLSGSRNSTADLAEIQFIPLSKPQIQCRFDGYLSSCPHPFNGNPQTNTDISIPFQSDIALSDGILSAAGSPDLVNVPAFVLGVAAIFNVPGLDKLYLDKMTLAKIFRGCTGDAQCLPGSITTWGDAAIKATNPPSTHSFLDAAGNITVVTQADENPTTLQFKRVLASWDPDFAQQVGVDDTDMWNGTDHKSFFGALAKIDYVGSLSCEFSSNLITNQTSYVYLQLRTTPGSISYTKLNLALEQEGVNRIDLVISDNGHSVSANSASLFSAFQEIGLAFGNDGSNASDMHIDLTGATGLRAWPIGFVGYFSFRMNLEDPSCSRKRKTLLSFLEFWYQQGQGEHSPVLTNGFAPLTQAAADEVLDLIRPMFKCNGAPVYQAPPEPHPVTVQVDESLRHVVRLLGDAFATKYDASMDYEDLESHVSIRDHFACLSNVSCVSQRGGLQVLADENLSSYILRDDAQDDRYELLSMPYCAMATGLIYNLCTPGDTSCPYRYRDPVILDIETSALILDNRITYWNDSRIQELNPDKLLPNQPIRVVSGPKTSSFHYTFLDLVRTTYLPTFSFRGGGIGLSTYYDAWVAVSLVPYTISFVPFNGTVIDGVFKMSLISQGGKPVQPSSESVVACAEDTYDPVSNLFFLSTSTLPDCWPLVQVFNSFVRKQVRYPTNAYFTQFMFNSAVRAASNVTVLSSNDLGTLVDLTIQGMSMRQLNFEKLESMTDSHGNKILMIQHELSLIPRSLVITMYFLMTLELIFFACLGVWVLVHRNRKLIRNSSPVFMMQVLFGAALMASTVIPLAQQDDHLVPRGMTEAELAQDNAFLDASCVAQPVLFSFGFFITFSALFLKSWRLIRIFNNKKLRNLFLRDRQLLMYQIVVLVMVLILNLLWAVRDPLVWVRSTIFIDPTNGLVVSSIGTCYSRGGVYSALPLLIGLLLVLMTGPYKLTQYILQIPTEFNESKWTAMAMVFTLEAFIIGIPVLALANSQPVPGFIIKSFCCLIVSGATVALIFVPKVAMAYGWGVIEGESNPWRFVKGESGSGSNGARLIGNGHHVADHGVNSGHGKTNVQPSLTSLMESRSQMMVRGESKTNVKETSKTGISSLLSFPSTISHHLSTRSSPATTQSKIGISVNQTSPSFKHTSKRISKEFQGSTSSEALSKILKDDPMRRRFRRYLQTLKMEENVRFWDSVAVFRTETEPTKRFVSAKAIIQTFVLDSSPLQVNLSSKTKASILDAYNANDKAILGSIEFFSVAMNELFEDLRLSDAFRQFLENDTFSQRALDSKSDPLVGVLVKDAAKVSSWQNLEGTAVTRAGGNGSSHELSSSAVAPVPTPITSEPTNNGASFTIN